MEDKQNNRPDDSEKDFDSRNSKPENNNSNDNEGRPPRQGIPFFVVLLIIALLILLMPSSWSGNPEGEIPYGMFIEQLQNDNIAKVEMIGAKITGEFKKEPYNPEFLEYCKSKGLPLPADAIKPEQKPAEPAPAESKPAETAPAEAKPAESTPAEESPAETSPEESTPVESKSEDSKPEQADSAPGESETAKESKPAESIKSDETKINDSSKNRLINPSNEAFSFALRLRDWERNSFASPRF